LNQLSLATPNVFSDGILDGLFLSFTDAVKLSTDDIQTEMELWFDNQFPKFVAQGDEKMKVVVANLREMFVKFAISMRPIIKMSRIGVGARLLMMSSLSYFDMVTDFLVSKKLWKLGLYSWCYASLTCVGSSLSIQVLFCYIQYGSSRHGMELAKVMIPAALGLSPLMQSHQVWTGQPNDGERLEPLMMLAFVKGEIMREEDNLLLCVPCRLWNY